MWLVLQSCQKILIIELTRPERSIDIKIFRNFDGNNIRGGKLRKIIKIFKIVLAIKKDII